MILVAKVFASYYYNTDNIMLLDLLLLGREGEYFHAYYVNVFLNVHKMMENLIGCHH